MSDTCRLFGSPYGPTATEQFAASLAAQESGFSLLWDNGRICFESRQGGICIRQVFTVEEARRIATNILGACDKAEGK